MAYRLFKEAVIRKRVQSSFPAKVVEVYPFFSGVNK